MSVAKSVSLRRVKVELEKCKLYGEGCGWIFSDIDETNQSFTVKMQSPIDMELYLLEVIFSDYPELPLILDFIDDQTGEKGVATAFPKSKDSFFHRAPCICNPCSRKSYRSFHEKGPHGPEDWNMPGWQQNPKVGSLKSIDAILKAIYSRISNDTNENTKYLGRMAKRPQV